MLSEEEHLEHLKLVFELLRKHALYAKESKCKFFQMEIHYLGHVISADGLRMDQDKVDAIVRWPHPKNLEELQIFLGMAGFYRKFIKDYAKIAVPMTWINLKLKVETLSGAKNNNVALTSSRWL